MSSKAIIVGGGLAGLATAAALAERDVSVMLLESRPRLGGRASSFGDRTTETQIDNCQHVTMGCCTNFQHFCRTVGLSDLFRRELELFFIGPGNSTATWHCDRLTASRLPAPFHLFPAFSKISYLKRQDKFQLAKGLKALAAINPNLTSEKTIERWLWDNGQTATAIERFWNLVLVSALGETPNRISVPQAQKVFVDAFLANRSGWEVSIPVVPLDDLYGLRLTEWLAQRGVTIRLRSGVQRLLVDQGTVVAVELRDGQRLSANHFVVAVPHHLVLSLLPVSMRTHPQLAGVNRLQSAPIASVHLWFDRPITTLPHAVFVNRLSQWMFNRSVLQSVRDSRGGQDSHDDKMYYYQIVISAARNLAGLSQRAVAAEVTRELTEVWPETANSQLLHSRLIVEHQAVFSPLPGVDKLRPIQQSPISNLQFAGDWTATGWPATMEGAVRSGYLAAENILRNLGRTAQILQPDLPTSLLSKLVLKL